MGGKLNFYKKTVRDLPLHRSTVLVRVDYNVPLDTKGAIDDDLRIRASLPTIRYLLEHSCRVVLISHMGRPVGRDETLSLEPVAERLSELLGKSVGFVHDSIGDGVHQAVKKAPYPSITLLENLRFYKEEEDDSSAFAKSIIKSVRPDFFVQDGFGVVHRPHASTHAITLFVPSVAGLLLEREFSMLTSVMEHPARPLVAVLGGAKVSDKIQVIERFIQRADTILIGGAMANTFLAFKGYSVGKSKVENGQEDVLRRIYEAAAAKVGEENVDDFIILPTDVAVAPSVDPNQPRVNVAVDAIADENFALDIGDATIERFAGIVAGAKTVLWNGPLGYAEYQSFAHGSARIALTLASHPLITSIIGGGDTADFALKWDGNGGKSFTHVSTGGGASLDLLSGKKLPGVESLLDA